MDFKAFYQNLKLLTEGKRPPGFEDKTLFPTESLEQFIEDEGEESDTNVDDDPEMVEEGNDVRKDIESKFLDPDIDDMIAKGNIGGEYVKALDAWKRLSPEQKKITPKPAEPEGALYPKGKSEVSLGVDRLKKVHSGIFRGFRADNGKAMTEPDLRALLTQRPSKLIGANSKLAKSGLKQKFYDLTMPAYKGLFYDEELKKWRVIMTCPFAGECKKWCYAMKGGYIQYKASSINSTRAINFLMNHYDDFKNQLKEELSTEVRKNSKQGNETVLRWHDAGDFMSPSYLELAYDVAKFIPEVTHYAYTKNVPLVRKLAEQEPKPDNFIFNFSFGGSIDVDAPEGIKAEVPVGEEEWYKTIDVYKEKHSRVVPIEVWGKLPRQYITKAMTPAQLEKAEAKAIASYDKAYAKYLNRNKQKSKMKEPEQKEIAGTVNVGMKFDGVMPQTIGDPPETVEKSEVGRPVLEVLKERVAKKYNLDVSTVVTYDELMKLPYDKNAKVYPEKYNVLVWKGHGDDAAPRKDVLGVYLFIH